MSARIEAFRREHPGVFLLDPADPGSLEAYLQGRGVVSGGGRVLRAGRAGEGNMNCTVRAATTEGSLIVKQARPWVEKYPQFDAPWDRAAREAEFYRAIEPYAELTRRMPRLIHFDPEARVLVLEDLGTGSDYTGVYGGERFSGDELGRIAGFLTVLHAAVVPPAAPGPLANRAMRALNHVHLFVVPLTADHGLDLDAITPGLAGAARSLQSDAAYVREVTRLGEEAYLADGGSLVHGDFFPGSLLRTGAGPRVIDAEFAFFGRPEFDVGVFLAHLLLAGQPPESACRWRQAYGASAGFDDALMLKLAGVEIMRRLIGYAQLPLRGVGGGRKADLLELSRRLVLHPRWRWQDGGDLSRP